MSDLPRNFKPPKYNKAVYEDIMQRLADGQTLEAVAQYYGVSRSSIAEKRDRYLRRQKRDKVVVEYISERISNEK